MNLKLHAFKQSLHFCNNLRFKMCFAHLEKQIYIALYLSAFSMRLKTFYSFLFEHIEEGVEHFVWVKWNAVKSDDDVHFLSVRALYDENNAEVLVIMKLGEKKKTVWWQRLSSPLDCSFGLLQVRPIRGQERHGCWDNQREGQPGILHWGSHRWERERYSSTR